MTLLKYALVGCGRRSRNHLSTVAQMTGTFEIAGVCDANPDAARDAGESLGVPYFAHLGRLLDEAKPDLVDVVVPNDLHHVISRYLSARGVPHNVETPLAPTLGLMDLMIGDAARAGIPLQTSENFPFIPVEQFVVKLIQAGVLGPVYKSHRLFSTTGYHGLAAIRCRMGSRPVALSSIAHTMPVVPYQDGMKRDYTTESLEFYAVDFENGGIAIVVCGNKNGCLGRNSVVGFETLGTRGTVVTNGNQGAAGGEAVHVCTDADIAERAGRARTYPFQREYTERKTVRRLYVELPDELGGTHEWVNPYADTAIEEVNVSLATMLDGLAAAVRGDAPAPLWPGEYGRADQEMLIAAKRSAASDRRPVPLPLPPDPAEEEAFDRSFEQRFGVHPREDPEKLLSVSFRER